MFNAFNAASLNISTLYARDANGDLLGQVDRRDGKWIFRQAGSVAQRNIEGHEVSPAIVDFGNNGIPDFLGGAEDGHFYFLKNPRAKK